MKDKLNQKIRMSGFSIRGSVRKNNEDNVSIEDKCFPLNHEDIIISCKTFETACKAGVFDGLGGELQGEKASYLAAKVFSEAKAINGDADEYLMTLSRQMNEEVCGYMNSEKITNMGTTLAALFFDQNKAYGLSMGDSRIYLYRSGRLRRLSQDHCFCRPGHIRRRLVMFLGASEDFDEITPDTFSIEVSAGDRFLICSDGVTDMIDDEKLEEILKKESDIDNCSSAVMSEVIRCGSTDNASMILAQAEQ